MRKLSLVLAAATALIAASQPSFAASRSHRAVVADDVNTVRTYGDRDDNNPPFAHRSGFNAYARGAVERADRNPAYPYDAYGSYGVFGAGNAASPYGAGRNLPYPDRPYGAPDRW